MRVIALTATGEHLARQFGSQPTPAMRILWHLRRRGGSSSDVQIKSDVVDGEEYALAMRKLRNAHAVMEA
jgi:hypothetical protein